MVNGYSEGQSRGVAPMRAIEGIAVVVAIALAVAIAGWLRAYDGWAWKVSGLMAALNVATSFVLFRGGLAWVLVPSANRTYGALWAALAWNLVPLSQTPYIGYFLIPVEILLAAGCLARRTPLRYWRAVLFATLVRLVVFVAMTGARPAIKVVIPWERSTTSLQLRAPLPADRTGHALTARRVESGEYGGV